MVRCVLFGVGAVGAETARLLAHKGIKVVAAYSRASHVGTNLGELARAGLADVTVRPVSEFKAACTEADIALFCTTGRLQDLLYDARQCLLAGIDVVTVAEGAFYPWTYDPETTKQLHEAALEGGATLCATGSQDSMMLHLAAAATGLASDVRRASFHMFSDFTRLGPGSTGRMQIGCAPEDFDRTISAGPNGNGPIMSTTGQIIEALAALLELGRPTLNYQLEPVTACSRLAFPARGVSVDAGGVSGMIETVTGVTSSGVEILGRLTAKLFEPGDVETFSFEVDGSMPFSLTLSPTFSLQATAASLVNRIPDVLASEPGFQTVEKLSAPRMRGSSSFLI
jgi:hypothetical protein